MANETQKTEDNSHKWQLVLELFEGIFGCAAFVSVLGMVLIIALMIGGETGLTGGLIAVGVMLFIFAGFYVTFRDLKKAKLLQWQLKLQEAALKQPPKAGICPQCGWQNDPQAQFCNRCGTFFLLKQ